MALLNTLIQKESQKDFFIEDKSVQRSDPFFGNGAQNSLWYTQIFINKGLVGEGANHSKKTSAHLAALNMFKNIFPRGSTWNDVKKFIAEQRKPLQALKDMKDTVQI